MNDSKEKKFQKRKSTTNLLLLGFVISLGLTLSGFEYATVDIKKDQVVTAKTEKFQEEIIFEVEVKKPELPNENKAKDNSNSRPVVAPMPIIGPIIPSPKPPVDPGIISVDPPEVIIYDPPTETPEPEDFYIVEEMPTYEQFLTIKDLTERTMTTQKEMTKLVNLNVKYPEMARDLGIQGTVYVDFKVTNTGEISEVKIRKGVHDDLDREAIRAVKTLPQMIPGKQRGKEVNVLYTIDIKFKLE